MVTGSVTLNNLNDDQIAKILEMEAHNSQLEISIPSIRQGVAAPSSPTHSGVILGWDTIAGYAAVSGLLSSFMQMDQANEKTA